MLIASTLPEFPRKRLRRILAGLPWAKGYRLDVKPLRYRTSPHLAGLCDYETRVITVQVPMKDALNGVMRQAYLHEVTMLMSRWNKMLSRARVGPGLRLPSQRFNRRFGVYAVQRFSPQGDAVDEAQFEARRGEWLPTEADRAHLCAIQQPVLERGRVAGWLAAPARGINSMPALDFDYVRL